MIRQLQGQIESYEIEMGMPLQKNLSPAEESRLDHLSIECDSLSESLAEISLKRTELEGEKKMQEIELNSNLLRRRDETLKKIDQFILDGDSVLGSRMEELQIIQDAIKTFEEKILGKLV